MSLFGGVISDRFEHSLDKMSFLSDSDRKCTAFPKIKEVRAYTKDSQKAASVGQGGDCHDVPTGHWIDGSAPHMPIVNPMSGYELWEDIRASWGINALGSLVVEVETTEGDKGVGVSIGGAPGCYIVEHHLSRFVEGQNPGDVELMWDQMYRATLNYGRKGLPLQAISAVDLALWDLLGHLRREPVYQMLGGRTKPFLPVYSTTCDALQAKKFGFVGAKIGCPYGPSAGDEGLRKNVCMLRETRNQVGEDFPLMLDCYMALTLPYAIRLAKELTALKFKWIEEALPPDDYQGYRELREVCRQQGLLVTTGEHEYTRHGFKQLLDAPTACDVIQPDVTWMGGITEARRVVAMASAYNIPVIPHGSSVYSYHLQTAFSNCPMAEYINLSKDGDQIVPYFGGLFPDEPLPQGGRIVLDPSRAGFGVTLNKAGLMRPYARTQDQVEFQFRRNAEYLDSFTSDRDAKPIYPF